MTHPQFLQALQEAADFRFSDGTDTWLFTASRPLVQVEGQNFIVLAEDELGESQMGIRAQEEPSRANLFLIEEGEATFMALSASELYHRKALLGYFSQLSSGKRKAYDDLLEQYKDCSGCLYWIASGLMTSEYDGRRYNPQRNRQAAELLEQVAAAGDPRACRDLASYYSWQADKREQAFHWMLKAASLGDLADKKRLADDIIDDWPDKIALALDLLAQLQAANYARGWCLWKEANIYLKGTGLPVDLKKGLGLLEAAAALEWAPAMADLSYFMYKGIGMEADQQQAIALLQKANSLSPNRYTDILKQLPSA
ncbi:SEL1-like repeat protein [Cesiribacter andamanensis]|uniref:Sel1 repeat protein n=1 Tax=Cesiribacter andamanensis AMV16 TaxID=1279009 RepID=M7N4N2_9BACT|nr:SEL1-like repeat protein [Cesiribacter andamanensis]EMR02247.1 Sel1 repeat protein [Cesiribacter andamanensis AMV16]